MASLMGLKERIDNEFYVIQGDEDKMVFGNHTCPFEDKVDLQETVANGDAGPRILVHLKHTLESKTCEGRGYSGTGDPMYQDAKGAVLHGPFQIEDEQYLVISAPILDEKGTRSGADLVLHKMDRLIHIITDYTGLGETGETILLSRKDAQFEPLFPLRNNAAPLNFSLDTSLGKALFSAQETKTNASIHVGSGDETALLAYGTIADSPWLIAIKMDENELYAGVKGQVVSIAGIIVLFTILGTTGMVFLLRPLAGKIVMHADELEHQIDEKTVALRHELEERKRAEEKLARTNKELDQFAYVVSHDLKALLRAIKNLSVWIEEDLGDDLKTESKKNMGLLRLRVQRMTDLICGVLEYSRIGRTAIVPETVETRELLREILDSQAHPESFEIKIDNNMPTLEAPRLLLNQVFANLVSNAVKYHDREDGVVEVSCNEDEDFYTFSVSDDGPGIPQEHHEKIFMIFQTLNLKKNVDSTGVGLTIVKKNN